MMRIDPTFRYPSEAPPPKAPDMPLLIGLGLIVVAVIAFAALCVLKAVAA